MKTAYDKRKQCNITYFCRINSFRIKSAVQWCSLYTVAEHNTLKISDRAYMRAKKKNDLTKLSHCIRVTLVAPFPSKYEQKYWLMTSE